MEALECSKEEARLPVLKDGLLLLNNALNGFQIGVPPRQIDLLFAISAVTFDEAWKESLEGTIFDGIPVRYLFSDHFIRNQTAAGRLQDLADVAAMLASRKANESKKRS